MRNKDISKVFKRTKIIATLGPSITGNLFTYKDLQDPKNKELVRSVKKKIAEMFFAGVNTVRLNFSHGTREEHGVRIKLVRKVANEINWPVSIMLDTNGPEIRVGKIKDKIAPIKKESIVEIYTTKEIIGDSSKFSVSDSSGRYNMLNDINVGNMVLVDDGKLTLRVTKLDKKNNIITTVAENSHQISTRKRINLLGVEYTIPFLSQKDYDDIKFGLENGIDMIAASFVNTADNVKEIRKILKETNNEHIKIISKIESNHAIKNIDSIISVSDGIMIARGDLSLEIPYYEVPYWEKYIIKACRFVNKCVIVATQMLDSLERNISPTRAEVTDVFFAVERGADATMLSGETANGLYPVQAVKVMATINKESEKLFDYARAINVYFPNTKISKTKKGALIKSLANKVFPVRKIVANNFIYDFVGLFSNDFEFLKGLSNIRFASSIIAVTNDENIYRCLGVWYGVYPYLLKNSDFEKISLKEKQEIIKKVVRLYSNISKTMYKNIAILHGNKLLEC